MTMIKIFHHYIHKRTLFQAIFDVCVVMVAVMASVLIQVPDLKDAATIGVIRAFLLGAGMLIINASLGFYQRVHHRSAGQSRARAMLSLFLTLLLAYAIFGLPFLRVDNKIILVISVVTSVMAVLILRVYTAHSRTQALLHQRVLVLGTGTQAKSVSNALNQSDPTVVLVGFYASPNETQTEVSGWGILSPHKSLTDIVEQEQVDQIVVAVAERRGGSMPLRELLDCKLQGVHVVDIATYFEESLGQIRLDAVSAGWLIFGDGFDQGWVRSLVKRVFDIVFATGLIFLTLPIMLVTAILIRMESCGPIIYRQERVGLRGRLFNVIKFRSMCTDAEKDGQPRWAAAGDSRVTRVGRVIRKLRIDELPQLFTVLFGQMSLVGPRPERAYFVDRLTQEIPFYAVRQNVKPGVTGWAQVRYHYGATMKDSAEKLQYDLYYVKNHTLFLDLIVLFETVGVVLTGRGAQ